jgi:biotin carboxyl carrier protein
VEAMKMENNITSNSSGTIKKVYVKVGQEVSQGELLVELAI